MPIRNGESVKQLNHVDGNSPEIDELGISLHPHLFQELLLVIFVSFLGIPLWKTDQQTKIPIPHRSFLNIFQHKICRFCENDHQAGEYRQTDE